MGVNLKLRASRPDHVNLVVYDNTCTEFGSWNMSLVPLCFIKIFVKIPSLPFCLVWVIYHTLCQEIGYLRYLIFTCLLRLWSLYQSCLNCLVPKLKPGLSFNALFDNFVLLLFRVVYFVLHWVCKRFTFTICSCVYNLKTTHPISIDQNHLIPCHWAIRHRFRQQWIPTMSVRYLVTSLFVP